VDFGALSLEVESPCDRFGGLCWGPFGLDLAQKSYRFEFAYVGGCREVYEGLFEIENGRWVARPPKLLYQALARKGSVYKPPLPSPSASLRFPAQRAPGSALLVFFCRKPQKRRHRRHGLIGLVLMAVTTPGNVVTAADFRSQLLALKLLAA
jgi:hypothetical protein